MSEGFDPYFKWLSIPPQQQPPDHYLLLGVRRFESNPDAIGNAVDARKRFVEAFADGAYAPHAQRLISEVEAAGACLLNSDTKSRYDKQLRTRRKKLKRAKPLIKAKVLADSDLQMSDSDIENASPHAPVKVAARTDHGEPTRVSGLGDTLANKRHTSSTIRPRLIKRKRLPQSTVVATATIAVLAFLVALIAIATFSSRLESKPSQPQQVANTANSTSMPSNPSRPTRHDDGGRPVETTSERLREPEDKPGGEEGKAGPIQTAVFQVDLPVQRETPAIGESTKETAKPTAAQSTGTSRRPVPNADKRAAAVVLVREAFEADFENAAGDREMIVKLLDEMFSHADQPELEDAELFAVLSEARRFAIQGGLAGHAIKAVERIGQTFEVPTWDVRLRTLQELRNSGRSSEAKIDLSQVCLQLLEEAIATDLYEVLPQLLEVSRSVTIRPTSDEEVALRKELVARKKNVEAILSAWEDLSQVRKTLEDRPDDSVANLRMGKFYCFVRNDWTAGLSYLALGGDHPLANAAMQELAVPADAAAQLELADMWYDAATDAMTSQKSYIESHALDWYRTCVSGLQGLRQAHAEKRIALLTPDEPQESIAARKEDLDGDGPEKLPTKIIARRVTRSAFAQFSRQSGDHVTNMGDFPHFVFDLGPRSIAINRTVLYIRAVFRGPATSSGIVSVQTGVRNLPFPASESNVGTWHASAVNEQWLKFNLSTFGNPEVQVIQINCFVTQGAGRIEPRIAIWAIDPDLEE